MAKYRLKEGFTHYENGPPTPTPAGTIVTLSDKRFYSLRDRFELVEESHEAPVEIEIPSKDETETVSIPAEEDDYSEWVSEIASMSAKNAKKTIVLIEEIDILAALLSVESRITVVATLEERIEEVA